MPVAAGSVVAVPCPQLEEGSQLIACCCQVLSLNTEAAHKNSQAVTMFLLSAAVVVSFAAPAAPHPIWCVVEVRRGGLWLAKCSWLGRTRSQAVKGNFKPTMRSGPASSIHLYCGNALQCALAACLDCRFTRSSCHVYQERHTKSARDPERQRRCEKSFEIGPERSGIQRVYSCTLLAVFDRAWQHSSTAGSL